MKDQLNCNSVEYALKDKLIFKKKFVMKVKQRHLFGFYILVTSSSNVKPPTFRFGYPFLIPSNIFFS